MTAGAYFGYKRLAAWGVRLYMVPLDSVLTIEYGWLLPVPEGFRVDGVLRLDGVLKIGGGCYA